MVSWYGHTSKGQTESIPLGTIAMCVCVCDGARGRSDKRLEPVALIYDAFMVPFMSIYRL